MQVNINLLCEMQAYYIKYSFQVIIVCLKTTFLTLCAMKRLTVEGFILVDHGLTGAT